MNITVSELAHDKLVDLKIDDRTFLRLAVKSGGCSGTTYDARIDDDFQSDDQILYHKDEVRIVATCTQLESLNGLNVDYSNDLVKSGFRLSNPKHVSSCGCGASFKNAEPVGCGNGN